MIDPNKQRKKSDYLRIFKYFLAKSIEKNVNRDSTIAKKLDYDVSAP